MRLVFIILGIGCLVIASLILNDVYANRSINDRFEGDETVDLTYFWITLGIGICLLVVSMAFNRDALADKRAPPYMGKMADADPGEPDKTLDKSGEVKRVGGQY